jgi:hypothetical protein
MPNAFSSSSVGTTPQFVYRNPAYDATSTDSRYASAYTLHNDVVSGDDLMVQWDEVTGSDWIRVKPGQSLTVQSELPAPLQFVRIKSASGTITVTGGIVGKRTAQDS